MAFKFGREELTNVVTGGIILGSGGGGDAKISFKLMEDILRVEPEVPFVSLEELPDDATVCVISAMGSPMATKKLGFDSECCVKALDMIQAYLSREVEYLAAFETGGGNFLPPLYTACRKGIKAIDADGVGRAVPETHMTMLAVNGVAAAPTAMSDGGERSAIFHFVDCADGERLGRAFTEVLDGASAGVANYLMDGKTAKQFLVGGTYSRAEAVGRAVRRAQAEGTDPVKALCDATGGIEIIRGVLSKLQAEVVHAHDWGYQVISGSGCYEGQSVTIHLENENIVAFDAEGKPRAITPDLLCVLGTDGAPLTNADLEEGMQVAFVGIRCAPAWENPKAYDYAFRDVLAHFGYKGPYLPVEELNP